MAIINLKDFYYWYTQDQFIEISDEVAEVFLADARYEMAYQRRLSRHKAQYSLDCEDGIEYSACLHEPTPQELLERMELFIRLWNALNSLPEVQGRRVDACVILGKTYHITNQRKDGKGMERKQKQEIADDRQKQGNPADETVIYKIGSTFYEVSTSCGGSEPLFEKMKRLIKSVNLKTPADKGKEVRYNEDSNLSVGRSLQEE